MVRFTSNRASTRPVRSQVASTFSAAAILSSVRASTRASGFASSFVSSDDTVEFVLDGMTMDQVAALGDMGRRLAEVADARTAGTR